ncbi:saccharopine dehydrogenase family protein [Candidatus Pseudothioglobus singularis]|uniref:Saccharopine dehydrogenase n=1 Tax=Candidatus Pseudothioglobus singularis PS1 TaxID=1125411 RepID=A0A0M4L3T4_9GAMM|nr:saccharopine dehydrogenase C-terminal domain-containing protein [Candidatus Pseudothioglobus singularis]ALE01683.1 saccharopine dehydrogenase [Candidatus Pseudothioglobus singularis PS1]
MPTIHWLGTGLSAIPGLKKLIEHGHSVIVYNRTVDKAIEALSGVDGDYQVVPFSIEAVKKYANAGDVVVSMLPGNFHVPVAELCISLDAHFVSSSYISDEMRDLNSAAIKKGLCLVNEVGLDPGIDHSMSHALVEEYRNSSVFSKENSHSFLSYCGGLSDVPNDFCYKFSWSPLGVLKALMSTSVSIRNSEVYTVTKPWESVEIYPLPMPWGEDEFEVYPNRDSRPFIEQYQMDDDLKIEQFVRGTLRYKGWKSAWSNIFSEVDSLNSADSEARLKEISDDLWSNYSYKEDEVDRVILTVELKVKNDSKVVWHKQFLLDTLGNSMGSAMAQLVSCSVALAVEAVMGNEISAGVSAAPHDSKLVDRWLKQADDISDHFVLVDHLN